MRRLKDLVSGTGYLKIALDLASITLAFYVALALRFELDIPALQASGLFLVLPAILLVFYVFNTLMGLYSGRWKYASFDEILNLSSAAFLSAAVIFAGTMLIPGARSYLPASVAVMGSVLSLFVMAFVRLQYRVFAEFRLRKASGGKNVLLVGAGEAGEMVARDMMRHPEYGYNPAGFVDDDPAKQNLVVRGVPVLGKREDIPRLVRELDVQEIFIAIPSLSGEGLRELVSICEHMNCNVKILPPLLKTMGKKITMSSMREVHMDDLLGREPVQLREDMVSDIITSHNVMITGGSGSIGSRLAKHIAAFGPKNLILLDNNESGLFEVEQELKGLYPHVKVITAMADIRDEGRINKIFHIYKPDFIFHTAASKHVPMMEMHPSEAVKNNVLGTKILAEAAKSYGCKGFVFFSSIKAEKPDNIMGATKNIAEKLLFHFNGDCACRFASFRLGNVLGTRGSVTTVFERLIQKGRPVTITHPDASRYFLTIDEAALLVLQSCAMMEGGEIFIPDMGEPVRIKDLAESMINLMRPEDDIQIVFTGLRPGEKVQEELLLPVDIVRNTCHERIFRLDYSFGNKEEFFHYVDLLIEASARNDEMEVKRVLSILVPSYKPKIEGEDEVIEASHKA